MKFKYRKSFTIFIYLVGILGIVASGHDDDDSDPDPTPAT